MKRVEKNILRRIIVVVLMVAAGFGFYLFNAQNLVGNAMPMPFGVGAAVVLSGSMEPTLSVNDLVIVKAQDEYLVDDIIVYQERNYMVIHRVIGKAENMLQTQGDANNTADEPIEITNVKGKMVARIPLMGAAVQMIKTPVGIFVLLAAAVLLTEMSFRKEKQKGDDELEKIKEEIRRLREEEK